MSKVFDNYLKLLNSNYSSGNNTIIYATPIYFNSNTVFTGNTIFSDGLSANAIYTDNYLTSSGAPLVTLPSQTGNGGKYLTSNGSVASWASVDALPSQTGNSGKYLTTNGVNAIWSTVDSLPTQTDNSGKFLTSNGVNASWSTSITQPLNVANSITSSNGLYSSGIFNGTFTDGIVIDYTSGMGRISVGSSDGLTIYNSNVGNNALVSIAANGNFYANANLYAIGDVYSSYSDDGLKIRLGPIEDPILKIKTIDAFYYQANEIALSYGVSNSKQVGVSAQTMEQVLPEVVGESGLSGYKTVRYERIVPLLIAAIQDQQKQIDKLKEQVNGLYNR